MDVSSEYEQIAARLLDREWEIAIGGTRATTGSRGRFVVTSPYSGETIAEVPNAGADEVNQAVAVAALAQSGWAAMTVHQRGDALRALAAAIDARAAEFAAVDAIDGGAPVTEMFADVRKAVNQLRYFAGLGLEMKGYTVPASNNLHFTELSPYGVVARIIPFNHPFMFAASKIAAPLMAGNAVILKPAETTPLSALLLAELAQDYLPTGVLTVIVGDGPEVPDALVRHPLVRRIGFIGSPIVGRAIQRSAAEVGVKHVSLELGGKNVLLAFPDADPDAVAAAAIAGMNFTWAGQSCGSTSRLLVHADIADAVLARITELLGQRSYLSPLDPEAQLGTLVSRKQFDRVRDYIDGAVAEGATVVAGGRVPDGVGEALFVEPTFLDNIAADSRVATEEIFGPVVSVLRWTDLDDALRIANGLEYGLTGCIFTNDITLAHTTARRLETGYVWINTVGTHYLGLPYGGWKDSGIGGEESIEELLSYTRSKSISVALT
ncbi:MAG TPA: aldehyde dehydrogenase family protein [Pseudolysinimonas sp.]|nr:aldehyde dehydrogenase family protein [Pseudolysinimonas sp.]